MSYNHQIEEGHLYTEVRTISCRCGSCPELHLRIVDLEDGTIYYDDETYTFPVEDAPFQHTVHLLARKLAEAQVEIEGLKKENGERGCTIISLMGQLGEAEVGVGLDRQKLSELQLKLGELNVKV